MQSDIKNSLAKKTIAITGATGFLGTCLVEKLLRSIPDCNLLLLVRPGTRGAQKRVDVEILNNNAFDGLKETLGKEKFQNLVAKRVTSIPADITQENLGLLEKDLKLLAKADIFIHSAAAVSFTSQLSDAVETNLLGPVRILKTLKSLSSKRGYKFPHLISVSTAYVAATKKGLVEEKLLDDLSTNISDIDIEAEIEYARRAQASAEDESRSKALLDHFNKEARRDLGSAAGTTALAKKREQLRRAWVKDRLVEMGNSRASSFGFADVYGFTKAMAEKAICQNRADIPLSIVRPSIIESSLLEPFPGWIRGFRMAEPIIISYARGLLKDFPAKPDGVLDVIPVDLVVATICAVAASPPPSEPNVFNVASGSTNPFLFRNLHDLCHDWFTLNPIYDENNKPISPAKWSYPNRTKVEKQLKRTKQGLKLGDTIIRKLPIRGNQALAVAGLEENIGKLDRVEGYLKLYGKYLECDAIFGTKKLLALFDSLSESDKKDFAFDPRVIDWHKYITQIHLPSVVIQGRIKTKPTPKESDSFLRGSTRLRKAILSPERHLAVFDLENTIIASNVVASWGWLATRHLSGKERFKFITSTLLESPRLISMDRASREDFLQYFYKRYKGASVDEIHADSQEMFSDLLLKKSFPAAVARIRKHRELGHRTLLLTGALDFVVKPLEPLFDDIICTQLDEKHGKFTGALKSANPIGELRAEILRNYALQNDISLGESVAYADSVSDLAMLEAVGFPVAVNPEIKLASIAKRRGWLTEIFPKGTTFDSKLLPVAPFVKSANEK